MEKSFKRRNYVAFDIIAGIAFLIMSPLIYVAATCVSGPTRDPYIRNIGITAYQICLTPVWFQIAGFVISGYLLSRLASFCMRTWITNKKRDLIFSILSTVFLVTFTLFWLVI